LQGPIGLPGYLGREGGIQITSGHSEFMQSVDLVLHQGDQRRGHNAGAGSGQSRTLVQQRLTATGRHQHQNIVASNQVVDNRFLGAPETTVTKSMFEDSEGSGHASLPDAGATTNIHIILSSSPPPALRWYCQSV